MAAVGWAATGLLVGVLSGWKVLTRPLEGLPPAAISSGLVFAYYKIGIINEWNEGIDQRGV